MSVICKMEKTETRSEIEFMHLKVNSAGKFMMKSWLFMGIISRPIVML